MRKALAQSFILFVLLFSKPASAAKIEKSFGIGLGLYSGKETTSLTPMFGGQFSFYANYLMARKFHLINRFELGIYGAGANFGGQYGAYNGYYGSYESGFKIVFVTAETIQPYIEIGPQLALFGAFLSSAGGNVSMAQTAFKFGYHVGLGADFIKGGGRGEGGGWGLGVNYSKFMRSPSVFEFQAIGLAVTTVKLEVRFILAPLD